MQDTGIHYVEYDAGVLWQKMLEAYVEAGGDILYPGSEKEILLRGVQLILMIGLAKVDNGLRMATLRYAVRDYLKLYGEGKNCPYIEATKAKATVTITFRSTGVAQIIAEGEALTADGVVLYTLDEDVEDTGASRSVTVGVTCSKAGAAGNGLLAGTQMQFMLQHDSVVSVVCASDAAGGQDDEDQEHYRERIHDKGLVSVTTGTEENYRSAAMAVSSVILDARALQTDVDEPDVCVYLLLSDNTGAEAIIAAVEEALNAKTARPLTDHVSVALATAVSYSLKVSYTVDAGQGVTDAVEAAAAAYVAWQNGSIGRPFNPDKLISLMYQAGATRVTFDASSRFNGSATIQYTEIDPNKVCAGTVTAEVTTS